VREKYNWLIWWLVLILFDKPNEQREKISQETCKRNQNKKDKNGEQIMFNSRNHTNKGNNIHTLNRSLAVVKPGT
jgi:hypothetical protein